MPRESMIWQLTVRHIAQSGGSGWHYRVVFVPTAQFLCYVELVCNFQAGMNTVLRYSELVL